MSSWGAVSLVNVSFLILQTGYKLKELKLDSCLCVCVRVCVRMCMPVCVCVWWQENFDPCYVQCRFKKAKLNWKQVDISFFLKLSCSQIKQMIKSPPWRTTVSWTQQLLWLFLPQPLTSLSVKLLVSYLNTTVCYIVCDHYSAITISLSQDANSI